MTPTEVLNAIKERGGDVRLERGMLAVHPADVLTNRLRAELRRHKEAIIELLKPQWRELTPDEQTAEAAKFDERGWIAIYSEHLSEVVIIAKDGDAAKTAPDGFTVYTAAEVAALRGATPDELKQVHVAKKFWNGTITGKEDSA